MFFPQSSTFRLLVPLAPALGALAVPRSRVFRIALIVLGVAGQVGWVYIAWWIDGVDWTPAVSPPATGPATSESPQQKRADFPLFDGAGRALEFWSGVVGVPAPALAVARKRHNPKTVRKNTGDGYHGCLSVTVRRSSELNLRISGWCEGLVIRVVGDRPAGTLVDESGVV